MTTLKTLAVAAAAALGLGACAPAATTQKSFGVDRKVTREVPATIRVENQNWSDMVVYAVQGSMRIRLGTVTSMRSESFRLPHTFQNNGGEMRLLADPIGSFETYLSDPIRIRGGSRVALSVQNSLQLSNIAVWEN